jgi:DNA-binding IclR family transcriptional regulator
VREIKSTYTAHAVEQAFDLLNILSAQDTMPTVALLAKRLGLSNNKAFRLASTLMDLGLIERDDMTGVYRLGLSAFGMAQRIINNTSLVRLVHPTLDKLANKHNEAMYITVVNNDEILFLDMVDSFQTVRPVSFLGLRLPFFTNAAGKIIEAMSSSNIWDKFNKRSANKIGLFDIDKLVSELNEIRAKGFAVDFGGCGEGLCAIAVAIKDYTGIVAGALTMLAPSFRMLQERIDNEIVSSMVEAGAELSIKLGYDKIMV